MNPTSLFNSVILSSGAMTNRLNHLEAMGLVERQPDLTDRRGRLVALTDRGRELVDAAVVNHLENQQRLLGLWTPGSASSSPGCCASSCCRRRSASSTQPSTDGIPKPPATWS